MKEYQVWVEHADFDNVVRLRKPLDFNRERRCVYEEPVQWFRLDDPMHSTYYP